MYRRLSGDAIYLLLPLCSVFLLAIGADMQGPHRLRGQAVPFALFFMLIGLLPLLTRRMGYLVGSVDLADIGLLGEKGRIRWDEVTSFVEDERRGWVLKSPAAEVRIPRSFRQRTLLRLHILSRLGGGFQLQPGVPRSTLDLHPTPPLPGEGRRFNHARFAWLAAFFVGLGGMALYSLLIGSERAPARVIMTGGFGLFFAGVGIVTLYLAFAEWVHVTTDGITYRAPFARSPEQILWRDVVAFELQQVERSRNGTTSTYMIRSADTYIELESNFSGWKRLYGLTLAHLPPGAIVDV